MHKQIPAYILDKVAEITANSRARFGHGVFAMKLVEHSNPVIARLEEQRSAQLAFVDELCTRVEADNGRDMVEAERANVTAARERIAEIDEQLSGLYAFEEARGAHRETTSQYRAVPTGGDGRPGEQRGGQPLGYTAPRAYEYRSQGEIIADTLRSTWNGDEGAHQRLESAGYRIDAHDGLTRTPEAFEQRAAQATADTAGILPETIVGQIESDVDAARPFMTSVGVKPLAGVPGKVFHRPIVTQHTTSGAQSAENADLPTQKMTIGDVDFTKSVHGGYVDISRQDIDWTSPSAWDALLNDMQEQYAIDTENTSADAFVTSVTAETDTEVATPAAPTVANYLTALYQAAALSYAGAGRLPDGIWCSLDMWASMGPLIDALKASTGGDGGGDSALDSFAGNLLRVPRIVVPSAATGTLIVGVRSKVEVYEERIGFLQAVLPKSLGVQVAHGGVIASGTLKAAAFAKVTFTAIVP